ncbi:AraC-like DNA-binding protein [Paenibacillus endophyticus]|uniref:AraC-like DNA-binding protein n=1 Tax=Paenibacillus endophyticus TaxID=1294268 RepID=A0A7W5CBU2_9BACL|nr:helix-turn-helix domain-containing protein [Paenibacillus endophyticus]MBB3154702.1 AraC-like DNA-binding protein [Paenibacillus endophyticus]
MESAGELTDLDYLCKYVHESLQLPVFCKWTYDNHQEFIWSAELAVHPTYPDSADLFRFAAANGKKLNRPIIFETHDLEQFAVVPAMRNGQCMAVIVIGPTIRRNTSELNRDWLIEHGILVQDRPKWMEYMNSLPLVDHFRFLHICVLANWIVNREPLDITDVLQSTMQSRLAAQQQENELELADRREYSIFHDGIVGVNQMLALITRGDKKELMKQLIKATNGINAVGVQSKRSQIRSVKNPAICGIALSSRAAIEGGVYQELAMTLCDLHVQHIEELNELGAIETAVFTAISDFADRVNQCRNNNHSKPVQVCKEYIYLHIFEELTLQLLSELSGLNPHYLSQLFKKETGLTLMSYIQRERIEEAKKLLDHSGDTMSRIGERLTFYDQAHFVKAFKKHTGMTPKQYRNRQSLHL